MEPIPKLIFFIIILLTFILIGEIDFQNIKLIQE